MLLRWFHKMPRLWREHIVLGATGFGSVLCAVCIAVLAVKHPEQGITNFQMALAWVALSLGGAFKICGQEFGVLPRD